MSTINISLPTKQAEHIDAMVSQYGFANRSEFIRSIVRFVIAEPDVVKMIVTYPFISPKTRSVREIVDSFKKTKRYSPHFINDLQEGLSKSNYFKP